MGADPLTLALLAGAVPLAYGALTPKPSTPSPIDFSGIYSRMNSPEMMNYKNQMLQSAFNPNSMLYNIASQRALAGSNRALAQRGMGSSGVGLNYINQNMQDLANSYLDKQNGRMQGAYGAAISPDIQQAQLMASLASQQNQDAWNRYNNQSQGQAAMATSLGNFANAGLSAYNYGQQNQTNQANNDRMFNLYSNMYGGGNNQPGSYYGNNDSSYNLGGNYSYGNP